MKFLYFDCSSGISGDMTVAALLDLGADEDVLRKGLQSLNLSGYSIKTSRVEKNGISAYDFDVVLERREHTHRHLSHIREIISNSAISEKAKALAEKIFYVVAKAEAKAHNTDIEEVHFHEVGAVDSIIDIVSTAICVDNLGIDNFAFSEICEGRGGVKCAHGVLPVPVPAVANIFAESDLKLKITENNGEMVTPTGAAIASALKNTSESDGFKIIKYGAGAGKKDFEQANVLRVFLAETEDKGDEVTELETNVDDCSGEALGYTAEKLMQNGALDVWFTPIYMKKGRPAHKLSVLCNKGDEQKLEDIIFKNTTTIGIRKKTAKRRILDRKTISVDTPYGKCRAKVCDGKARPEYDDVADIANKSGKGFCEVYDEIKAYL